jgi:Protein of unknown function (DUF3987)
VINRALDISPRYIEAALENECLLVAKAPPGDRNNQLFKSAAALGQLPIEEDIIVARLADSSSVNGLMSDDGQYGVVKTIKSGISKGRQRPRVISAPSRQHEARPRAATPEEAATAPSQFPLRSHDRFLQGDDLERFDNEVRRHTYRRADVPVQINIKFSDGRWAQWFRVCGEEGRLGWQPKKPSGYLAVPYFPLKSNPFDQDPAGSEIGWPEGERDANTLARLGLPSFTFGGTAGLPDGTEQFVVGRRVVIFADNDGSGLAHAESKAVRCHGVASTIKVIKFKQKDVSDWANAGHTADELKQLIAETPEWKPRPPGSGLPTGFTNGRSVGFVGFVGASGSHSEWPEPKPLPEGLLPVDAFTLEFVPNSLAPWIDDISNRMQCPPDYVAVSATVALGSLIGRKVGIRPQQQTDWVEIPNVWGCIIGRPGMLKSPAMGEAVRPLRRLEAEASKLNKDAEDKYKLELELHKIRHEEAVKAIRKGTAATLGGDEPEVPKPRRYLTNDTSYEQLGEILVGNPNGTLVLRDELVSLLQTLDREDQAAARGFYLSAWNGNQSYTFDRIGRGHRHIEGACISVLGSTQPGRVAEYVRRAVAGGAGDDGLIQRFGLMVWPDVASTWSDVDTYPNSIARENAWKAFTRIEEATPEDFGAQRLEFDTVPFLRFDGTAQGDFREWRAELEARLRSGGLSPALEGHLAKYRKLVPGIALINHLADGGTGPVGGPPTLKALSFAAYLESHARRVYGASSEIERRAAKAILAKIRSGDLKDGFTARDIQRCDWSNLTDRNHVQAGLDLLLDLDHLGASNPATGERGGRPKVTYIINPRTLR